ncbi:DUF4197 domain-containing protein [Magnetospirillum sp. UT-4]|uniref:DUF4197 domain-containing protein n=1 Tax=Magnetospirillum sp. UT-4 TaxID=2681467 RepID=UPI001384F9F4|nr:DUF4197 domain-containing protein [Magnetospirillum sp. UT-4]CAA7621219.1 conserved exported hypothetical protein [Magnetospirillum sp. UT-4]
MKAVAIIVAACLATGPAAAQGGLMEMGKGMLQERLGQGGGAPATGSRGAGLGAADIASGLKEALKVASERVTGRLGGTDGFNADPAVHIPLPGSLKAAQSGLKMAGQSGLLDDLEVKLNRAAEAATPQARKIFWDAVNRMSLDDARGILNGPDDAATQYFKRSMSPDLKTAMRPVVDRTVAGSGAVAAYKNATAAAGALPLAGQAAQAGPGMLTDHVLDHALAGIFTYLGQEEAAIRRDPAKRSTDLLKKVFGG